MNKHIIITILLALVAVAGQAQIESVKELTMKSEYFNHERQVLIYTPGGYQQFDQTYYDVIYVFDAQDRTMFDLVHCLLNIACKPDPDGGRSMNVQDIATFFLYRGVLLIYRQTKIAKT